MALTFRLLDEKHVNSYPLLYQLKHGDLPTPWEWEQLPRERRGFFLPHDYLIALEDGVPVGFIPFDVSAVKPRVFTKQSFVISSSQKKGIAEALIKQLTKHCRTRGYTLIVRGNLAPPIIRQVERFEKNGMGLPFRARTKKVGLYDAVIHVSRRPSMKKVRTR